MQNNFHKRRFWFNACRAEANLVKYLIVLQFRNCGVEFKQISRFKEGQK